MGRDADKPRGRMSTYAFFVQTCRSEHKKKHPNESVGFAEFSKKCAERWKTMSDQEKSRFHQMADKDKKRYDNEMSTYKPPKGEKGKKRKRTKDPDTPKRSLSAFFWFCNDERPKVKETMPDSTFGEVAKELGRRWNDVTDETKSRNEALAAKDKARYEKEMKLFKGKKGKPSPSALVVAPPPMEKEEYEEEEEDEEVEEVEEEVEGEEEEEEEEDDE